MQCDNQVGNRFVSKVESTLFVAGLILILTSGCSGGGTETTADAGARLYRQNCALCHGARGEGKPSMGAALQGNEFVQSKSDDELVQFLIEGRPADHPLNDKGIAMPSKGGNPRLTDEDLAQIVAYMRELG